MRHPMMARAKRDHVFESVSAAIRAFDHVVVMQPPPFFATLTVFIQMSASAAVS